MNRTITTILIVFLFLASKNIFAQYREPRGRYYPGDENIGLPPLGFTGESLVAALILFVLGWIINKATKKPNGEGGSALSGCLLMLGFVCAIPSLLWLQTIVAGLWVVGIGVIVIIVAIAFLWNIIKEK